MHPVLDSLKTSLRNLIAQVQAVVPNDEPLSVAHNNWSFTGLTRPELIEHAQSIITLIEERGLDEIPEGVARLKDYARRIEFLRLHTTPQIWSGNSALAVSAFVLTLDGLRRALEPAMVRDNLSENATAMRKVTLQLRSMEARLKAIEPRTLSLASMVDRIEKAHDAADQLPTDLESLAEARKSLEGALSKSQSDQIAIASLRQDAESADVKLRKSVEDADATLARCETAYSGATSVGLGAAFSERSKALGRTTWVWVGGLIFALGAGGYFGTHQLHSLTDLVKDPNVAAATIVLNMLLSTLSVAAPVWFAWVATKQIGHRFRLAEDYAFKASVSRAYEGYRREASRIDKDLEARLLASALTKFDEEPLRLVPNESHGSPWHELASSEVVKRAFDAVPGFARKVEDLARSAMGKQSSKPDAPKMQG